MDLHPELNVLVTRKIHPDAIRILDQHGFRLTYHDINQAIDPVYLDEHLGEFDGVLTAVTDKFGKNLLENGVPKLKVISNMAVGLDNIDVEHAVLCGIKVFNTPHVVTDSTADMTIALAFTLVRKIPAAHAFVVNGQWKGWDPEIFLGRSFSKLTWGIIGYGNIGRAVAQKLTGFGLTKYFYDPFFNQESKDAGRTDLETLLAKSDIISLHIPLMEQTRGFFDKEKFKIMKPNAILVNMARGAVVNSKDLIDALKENRIGGAALDVFDPEPIPGGHEILSMKNVVFTPHIGTATEDCRREMAIMAAENLAGFLSTRNK